MAAAPPNEQKPDDINARAHPGRVSKLVPMNLVRFLELLRHNGNVSMSARIIGWSRSTVYAFAGKNPSFREAMREAMVEGRELLVGEGWRRAYEWTEFKDSSGTKHVKPPSDRLLGQLIGGYFPEFKPGRGEEIPSDDLLPASADLTLLDDHELEALERILVKAGADESGPRES
jgi:hypothetical protein